MFGLRLGAEGLVSPLRLIPALLLDMLGGSLDPRVSFTRASSATYFGRDGLLKTQGFNLLTYSDNYAHANWAKLGAPTINGELVARSSGASTYVGHLATGLALGEPFSFQLKAKAANAGGRIGMRVQGAYPARVDAVFDLVAGTVVGTANTTYTVTNATITPQPNGYYLCTISGVSASSAPTIALFGPTDSGESISGWEGASDVLSDCYVKDAQLERAATPGNYSPTSGSTNGGPRFDYGPATPAGTTGVELAPSTTSLVGWTASGPTPILTSDGTAITIKNGGSGEAYAVVSGIIAPGKTYRVRVNRLSDTGTFSVTAGGTRTGISGIGVKEVIVKSAGVGADLRLGTNDGILGSEDTFSDVSVQEVTFAPRGLLIEEARTNLLLWSRDMTQGVWTKTDCTAQLNQIGIDGEANSACLITEGSSGGASLVRGVTVPPTATFTYSRVLKRGNTDWVRMAAATQTAVNGGAAWFNLGSGSKGAAVPVGTGTNASSTMIALGGGFYRCTVTFSVPDADTSMNVNLYSATADGSTTRVNGATYTVDCAQLEVGAFATSIIPTTSATVTRAADAAVMTGTNFSSWYNQSEGTFVVDGGTANDATPVATFFDANNNTFGERMQVRFNPATGQIAVVISANNVLQPTPSVISASRVRSKAALNYSVNGTALSTNGSAVQTGAAIALPAPVQLRLGAVATGGQEHLNGHIRRIAYYPTRLSNAQLQALTV